VNVLHAAMSALDVLFTPLRMGLLFLGVVLGLLISIIPGLGGIVGLSLLLPFTFSLDPYSAMALLMGLAAAVSHGDVIPAILFGVPGTVGCAATVMDGYPMAKRGEAGRALGAAFSASLIGGVFGALVLAVTIPIISPLILLIGTPEMLAVCVFGITLVASLSGNAPLRGLIAALIGLLLSTVGQDAHTSTLRFDFGAIYLWDGIPIVPLALAIFAIPELCDIFVNRRAIASEGKIDTRIGQWQGYKDVVANWFLVIRTGALGAVCGMVPGLGAAVVDWIAYAHALKTEKGAAQTFGKGDVRGVIAAESSTNAREGGSLVTTIAFGVPGTASMAILLGAFLIQGIVPGPDMLTKHLDLTYTIVWSLTLANLFGTVICFAFADQLARIAMVRYSILLPIILALVNIGAFEGSRSWGDIIILLAFGAFACIIRQCGWPRPPLVLGFILGKLIEQFTFISVERFGWSWMSNWFVMVMFALAAFSISQHSIAALRSNASRLRSISLGTPTFSLRSATAIAVFFVFVASLYMEADWNFAARLFPTIISALGVFFSLILIVAETFKLRGLSITEAASQAHFTYSESAAHQSYSERGVNGRAFGFFIWATGASVLGYFVGFVPALLMFTFIFVRYEGKEPVRTALVVTFGEAVLIWLIFDFFVHQRWPYSFVGEIFPTLHDISTWF
jgi:TctA family transporter